MTVSLGLHRARILDLLNEGEIEGLSTAEVAGVLGSSEVTVRSQISKAMVKLRGILNREGV